MPIHRRSIECHRISCVHHRLLSSRATDTRSQILSPPHVITSGTRRLIERAYTHAKQDWKIIQTNTREGPGPALRHHPVPFSVVVREGFDDIRAAIAIKIRDYKLRHGIRARAAKLVPDLRTGKYDLPAS